MCSRCWPERHDLSFSWATWKPFFKGRLQAYSISDGWNWLRLHWQTCKRFRQTDSFIVPFHFRDIETMEFRRVACCWSKLSKWIIKMAVLWVCWGFPASSFPLNEIRLNVKNICPNWFPPFEATQRRVWSFFFDLFCNCNRNGFAPVNFPSVQKVIWDSRAT